MKKNSIVLLLLLAVAIVASFASNSSDTSTALFGKPPRDYKQMNGVLSFVDAPARSIIVSNASLNRQFVVDAGAEILRNGEPCALGNLKKGNAASIYYSVQTGKRVAHRVITQEAAPTPNGHGKQETRPANETSDR